MRKSCALLLTLILLLLSCMALAEPITVVSIEKYGNLRLSVSGTEFLHAFDLGDIVTVQVGSASLDMPVCTNYSDVDEGSPICRVKIEEDDDAVILALNMDDLATTLSLAQKSAVSGEPGYRWDYLEGVTVPVCVTFTMKEQGGYLGEYLLRQLNRTNAREDYPHLTDEQFANFRSVTTSGMGEGTLYRSSSPVNPELGRNVCADAALRAAGVRTVVNLADTAEGMQAYEGWADAYYAGCSVIGLSLGVDFRAADFQAGLARGLRFMLENEGPYLVHCTEGKDRAGFVSAVLECLMGASVQEVLTDYMITYFNYYGVEPGTEQYERIAHSNIVRSLGQAFGVADITAEGVNLAAEAEDYLRQLGLADEEIDALRAKLGGK